MAQITLLHLLKQWHQKISLPTWYRTNPCHQSFEFFRFHKDNCEFGHQTRAILFNALVQTYQRSTLVRLSHTTSAGNVIQLNSRIRCQKCFLTNYEATGYAVLYPALKSQFAVSCERQSTNGDDLLTLRHATERWCAESWSVTNNISS